MCCTHTATELLIVPAQDTVAKKVQWIMWSIVLHSHVYEWTFCIGNDSVLYTFATYTAMLLWYAECVVVPINNRDSLFEAKVVELDGCKNPISKRYLAQIIILFLLFTP